MVLTTKYVRRYETTTGQVGSVLSIRSALHGTQGTNDGYMVAIVVTLSTDHRDTAVHWGLLFNQNHEHLGPAVRSSMKVWCSGGGEICLHFSCQWILFVCQHVADRTDVKFYGGCKPEYRGQEMESVSSCLLRVFLIGRKW